MNWFKNIIKLFLSKRIHADKLQSTVGIQQRNIMLQYQIMMANNQLPALKNTGFKVFSQFEEDGLLLYIFSIIGEGNRTFIEIGANDGINSNCSNLAVHFGWNGLFFEGDATLIKRGRRFYATTPTPYHPKPTFVQAIIKRENINELIQEQGLTGEISLLSIDIDGNDYWIWDALTAVQPNVVIIETNTEFGNENRLVAYDANYMYPGKHPIYHGASVIAMNKLADKKGYRLIGANDLGMNQIYIRKDLAEKELPTIDPLSTLWHPTTIAGQKAFQPIKNWDYLKA